MAETGSYYQRAIERFADDPDGNRFHHRKSTSLNGNGVSHPSSIDNQAALDRLFERQNGHKELENPPSVLMQVMSIDYYLNYVAVTIQITGSTVGLLYPSWADESKVIAEEGPKYRKFDKRPRQMTFPLHREDMKNAEGTPRLSLVCTAKGQRCEVEPIFVHPSPVSLLNEPVVGKQLKLVISAPPEHQVSVSAEVRACGDQSRQLQSPHWTQRSPQHICFIQIPEDTFYGSALNLSVQITNPEGQCVSTVLLKRNVEGPALSPESLPRLLPDVKQKLLELVNTYMLRRIRYKENTLPAIDVRECEELIYILNNFLYLLSQHITARLTATMPAVSSTHYERLRETQEMEVEMEFILRHRFFKQAIRESFMLLDQLPEELSLDDLAALKVSLGKLKREAERYVLSQRKVGRIAS